MAQKLVEKLAVKLQKLGLSKRKAGTLADGLAPTVQRAKVSGTVTGKLVARLQALGLSEKKAEELAKGLAPMVRASIKAKAKAKALTLDDVTDDMVNEVVTKATDDASDEDLDKVAPKVNGHRVRLDLPVVERYLWQSKPIRGIELLRVMDGLTTDGTYLVAAVKGDVGIVAVRQFDPNYYNVKFYPDMAFWKQNETVLRRMGAIEYLQREWYERMHFNREQLDDLMKGLVKKNKPGIKALLKRFVAIHARPLFKAFDYLHKRASVAA